jgi:uncharacterized protein YneF (UPF0154 family)
LNQPEANEKIFQYFFDTMGIDSSDEHCAQILTSLTQEKKSNVGKDKLLTKQQQE